MNFSPESKKTFQDIMEKLRKKYVPLNFPSSDIDETLRKWSYADWKTITTKTFTNETFWRETISYETFWRETISYWKDLENEDKTTIWHNLFGDTISYNLSINFFHDTEKYWKNKYNTITNGKGQELGLWHPLNNLWGSGIIDYKTAIKWEHYLIRKDIKLKKNLFQSLIGLEKKDRIYINRILGHQENRNQIIIDFLYKN